MSTLLCIALAGATLLPASVPTRRVAGAPPTHVKAVRVHAYALASSTVVGIDSLLIRADAPLKKRLQQPARFIRQLEAALATRDTVASREFKPQFVRFWFDVSYRGGGHRSIYVAQGSTLLLGHRLYKLDTGLKNCCEPTCRSKIRKYTYRCGQVSKELTRFLAVREFARKLHLQRQRRVR